MSIQGQCHFFTLAQSHLYMKIKTGFSKNQWAIFNQMLYVSFQVQENEKKYGYDAGHMTKMAAIPINGKILQKSSPLVPVDRFPRNFVCGIEVSCPLQFAQMMTLC